MAYFICEKQGRCCPHEFYDSIEQAITDSEDGVPCDHLIEVSPVRHGRWEKVAWWQHKNHYECNECSVCGCRVKPKFAYNYCPNCGAKMDGNADD